MRSQGVLITAVDTDRADRDDGHSRNLAFVIDIDDIKVCHLGDIQRVPTGDEVEELSGIDILLVPVGGGRVMGAAKAAEMVSLLEPKIVIPMTYKTDVSKGDFEGVDHFIKEMGVEAKAPEQRLNLSQIERARRDDPGVAVLSRCLSANSSRPLLPQTIVQAGTPFRARAGARSLRTDSSFRRMTDIDHARRRCEGVHGSLPDSAIARPWWARRYGR